MVITCPGCQKRLKVPDGAGGTTARCPACKGPVTIPGPPERVAPALSRREEEGPLPGPDDDPRFRPRRGEEGGGLRCAACRSPEVEKLPPNQFSRHPGYVCRACGATMRPPGGVGAYVFALVLGGLIVVLGVGMAVAALGAERGRGRMIFGGVALAGLGVAAAGWGASQMRLPAPLGAAPASGKGGPSVAFIAIVLAVLAGFLGMAAFGFLYFLKEML